MTKATPTVFSGTLLVHFLILDASLRATEPELNRYDLGQRLVQLEKAWDAHPDAAARARALPVLKLAVPQMLAGKMNDGAATLDRARLLLENANPSQAELWATALLVHPNRRLLDPDKTPFVIRVREGYDSGTEPAGVNLRFTLVAADGATKASATYPIAKLPAQFTLPIEKLAEGDYVLNADAIVGGRVLGTQAISISLALRLNERLEKLDSHEDSRPLDKATLAYLTALVNSLAKGREPETNYPATRLLSEAEHIVATLNAGTRSFGQSPPGFYHLERPGQFWLNIPVDQTIASARVFIPEQAKDNKPLPLVVALHGAGGSENLFFDAYGYGLIARLAKERGWMVVAPRAGWLFDGPPPVAGIVDELAKVYPVDKNRVYLVGHSMGAMQAVKLAQETPARFAAIAALGGGGSITKPESFKNLPVYIGVGSDDFLIGGAKGLQQALSRSGSTRVMFKEYPGVEHLLIVQEALPEVFKFFAASKKD